MLVDMPGRPGDTYTFWLFPHVAKLTFEPPRIGNIICIVASDELRATVSQPHIECGDNPAVRLTDNLEAWIASRHLHE